MVDTGNTCRTCTFIVYLIIGTTTPVCAPVLPFPANPSTPGYIYASSHSHKTIPPLSSPTPHAPAGTACECVGGSLFSLIHAAFSRCVDGFYDGGARRQQTVSTTGHPIETVPARKQGGMGLRAAQPKIEAACKHWRCHDQCDPMGEAAPSPELRICDVPHA